MRTLKICKDIYQCKLVVNIKKWVDINKYKYCLHKIGARLLGKLTICIDNAVIICASILRYDDNIDN